MAWIWTLLPVIVFLYILQELLSPKTKKRLPPGPRGLPILGHFHLLGKNPHRDLCHLARKHGPIMGLRFGFVPTVIASSPAAAELLLKTHDLVFASRPFNAVVHDITYEHRDLVFAPYGPFWRDIRKLCTLELLSPAKINQFEPMRRAELRLLVSSMKHAAEMREMVDLSAAVFGVSEDINCLMVFGKKSSDLEETGFKSLMSETMELVGKFNLADYFPYLGLLDLQGINRRSKRLKKVFDAFLEKVIDDHGQDKGKKKHNLDFVDTMMAVMESGEAEFEFDRRHVKAVLLDMLIAGTETSATAIEWALSELIRHPTVMKKLQQEMDSVVGSENMVEESHLHKLEYLNFVVKETLRLHPVATLLVPHESVQDCTVDGFHIPKSSRVMVNVWAIGRDPNVWHDPESFLPERFIGSNVDVRGHDFQLIPFGSGRRSCPGLQLGLTLVKLVVAQLVHCFHWELPDGLLPSDLDMTEHFGLVTARAKHLVALPTYRMPE